MGLICRLNTLSNFTIDTIVLQTRFFQAIFKGQEETPQNLLLFALQIFDVGRFAP